MVGCDVGWIGCGAEVGEVILEDIGGFIAGFVMMTGCGVVMMFDCIT